MTNRGRVQIHTQTTWVELAVVHIPFATLAGAIRARGLSVNLHTADVGYGTASGLASVDP